MATASLEEGEEGLLPGTVSARDTPTGGTAVLPVDARKKEWVDRYLSVSYPLQRIKINSSYGYRKDPFSGKRKFHDGIDLHARGDEVLSMMEGVVVKVGQDKASGKYVTLRHGNHTVSYCHLSKVLVGKGAAVRPRDVVGITGSTGRSTGPQLHFETRYYGQAFDPERLIDFESGILRRQTFLLKKSFFDIRSNAGQDFDDEAEVEKADKKEAAERAAVTYHTITSGATLGALARRYGTTVSKLCSLNGIKSTTILRLGRKLRVR